MKDRFETIYQRFEDHPLDTSLDYIKYSRDNDHLIPSDMIYASSHMFDELYRMNINDLMRYGMDHGLYLAHRDATMGELGILRVIIYYEDEEVQQKLREVEPVEITCRAQEDGQPIDVISQDKINPARLVYIPEDDHIHGSCYDVVTLTQWFERDISYIDDAGFHHEARNYTDPLTNIEISPDLVDRIIGGERGEKAWWIAYIEDYGVNTPYIPDPANPHKYKNLYQMESVDIQPYIDNLDQPDTISQTLEEIEDINILIDNCNDIEARYYDGFTLLQLIVLYTDYQVYENVLTMIRRGADPNSIDNLGWTALMSAVQNDYYHIVKLLITAGANVNSQDNYGVTPLILSMEYYNYDIIKLLLDNGADPNIQGMNGISPLTEALSTEDLRIIELLLNNHANPNITDDKGRTPLLKLFEEPDTNNQWKNIAHILLGDGAHINSPDNIPHKRWTPLMYAVHHDRPDMARFLLYKGAHPNMISAAGDTALMTAIYMNNYQMVRLLLNNYADPNIRDNNGITGLTIAVSGGEERLVELLLVRGSNPNIPDNRGYTPLMRAVLYDYLRIAELLLNYAADPYMMNINGQTVMLLAPNHHDQEVIANMLVQRGITVDDLY